MTYDEFNSLVKQPELVTANHEVELKEIVQLYPEFTHARFLYLKALQLSKSVGFQYNLKVAPVYCSNKHWLFYYLYPENKLSNAVYRRESENKSSGDYFDMINRIEKDGADTKQSLKNLAEKLKSARSLVSEIPVQSPTQTQKENNHFNPVVNDFTETKCVTDYFDLTQKEENPMDIVKKYIAEKKYHLAIEILRKLNLNNPKKSVYFADQIRFLEKIIANSKK